MSSLKLDRNLVEKTAGELEQSLAEETARRKVWRILTIVTAAILAVCILIMVFTGLNNPLIAIIPFALFITSFMLFAYSRQNIAELEGLIREKKEN